MRFISIFLIRLPRLPEAPFSISTAQSLNICSGCPTIGVHRRFDGIYWCDGDCVANAKVNIDHIMRDIRTEDVKEIDMNLLDLIYAISTKLQAKEPFTVISGYRSRKTNELLRKLGSGAAKNSYHIKGQAVDIRNPGYKASVIRRVAYELKIGGVGYYPKRRFVHIDVGPVRYWTGKK